MLDTFGWDLVYATTLTAVDAAVKASGRVPASFSGGGVAGDWGAWDLVPGAPSNRIVVGCTVASGTATLGGKSLDLAGSTIRVLVTLAVTADGTIAPVGGDAVVLDRYSFPPGVTGDDVYEVAKAFHAVLQQQVPLLAGAFGSITTGVVSAAPAGDRPWIVPTSAAVAVTPLPANDQRGAIVALLAMTEHRSMDGLQLAVDGRMLDGAPAGCDRAVALGPHRVDEDLLKPAITSIVQGSSLSDFAASATGTIYNTGTMTWGAFTYTDADGDTTTIHPTIPAGNLQLTLNGAVAHVSMSNVHFPYPAWHGPGEIRVAMDAEQFVTMGIVRRDDGHLVLAEIADPVQSFHVTVIPDHDVQAFQIAVNVALQVLFAVIGGALDSAAGAAENAAAESVEEEASGQLVSDFEDEEIVGLLDGHASEEDIERAEEEAGQQAGEAVVNGGDAGWVQSFKSAIMANRTKILLKVIEKAVEIPAGKIVDVAVALARRQYDQLPTIDPLAVDAALPVTWADREGITFEGGKVDGAIVFWGMPTGAAKALRGGGS
ncbi:TULIP family P47-like protein [Salinarimonas rosea]|uniref:TULIP family P47-like protein n=1 Tax=Salinarimonas rosea TaxID=552063 RepID=UPI000407793B|nr:TULIP family P47-like protein [Salinarimonas rosea]